MHKTKFRTSIISLLLFFLAINVAVCQNSCDTLFINSKLLSIDSLIIKRKFSEALATSHQAKSLSKKIKYTKGYAYSLYYTGASNYALYKNDSAIFYMTMAERIFKEHNLLKERAKALIKLGDYYRLIDKNDSSVFFYNKATDIAKSIMDLSILADSYIGLGRTLIQLGNYKLTMELYSTALKIKTDLNEKKGIVDVLNSIGIVFKQQGDPGNALDFYLRAITLRQEINDTLGIAHLHNNIGLAYRDLQNYPMAHKHLKQSYKIKERLHDVRGLSITLMNFGSVYLLEKKFDSALVVLNQAEIIKEQLGEYGGLGSVYSYQGEAYRNLGNYQLALKKLTIALEISRNNKEPVNEAEASFNLGITYLKSNEPRKGLSLLDESSRIAQQLGMLNLQARIYEKLHEYYKQSKQYDKSLLYYSKYICTRDSILKDESIKKMLTIQLRDEFDKKIEQQNAINKEKLLKIESDNLHKTRMFYFFLVAFIIAGGIMVLFIHLNKQKRVINNKLKEKQIENEKQREELINQRDQIISILTDIGASLDYAKRIQMAILPTQRNIERVFQNYFIINQPRDTVGGDFFWLKEYPNHIVTAVGDSTGHGIPGGFMSMLGISALDKLLATETTNAPSTILDMLRDYIITTLNQNETEDSIADGMDISLCFYNPSTSILSYAGANLSILIYAHSKIETNERIVKRFSNLYELLPDRMPISNFERIRPFSTVNIKLSQGDTIYLYSDGYADQFGGDNDKKFGFSKFRSTIDSVKDLPMWEQKTILWDRISKWKKNAEFQTDDILVLGIKIE